MEREKQMTSSRLTRFTFSAHFYFILFGMGGFFPLLSTYFLKDAGLNGTQIGAILSLGPIIMVFAQPLWGLLCDTTQRSKQVLMGTTFFTGLSGLGYLINNDYGWMLGIAAILAVFQAALVPISDSLAMSYVQREGGDYGKLRLWGAVGFASAAYFIGEWAENSGLMVIFIGFAGAMTLSAVTASLLPRERVSFDIDLRTGLSRLMKLPQFPLFLMGTFFVFGPIQANNVYFGLLIQDLGGTLAGVGIGFLLAAGSEAPVMRFASKWISRRGLLSVVIFASLVSAARWLFYGYEPSVAWVYITTVSQGLSVGLFIPAALQYVQDIAPKEVKTTAIALYTAAGTGLGNWFFSLLGGVIFDHFGIYSTYLFFGISTLCGVGMVLWVQRLDRKSESSLERSSVR
ncbi:MFS transporter, PPP family, 3-phenylpropionic acid transporter [Marininema mesophilum]|uniref:MFS transporter, PPP family, 3-phenylpropionic acid transporter n=1 Tax=Marininema mesophilum TaxID=1048340 RepID=A0A1H2QWP9_9BACL|nr:MFS transporter [Marininema mesophilum]SDW11606.1 MFS transporter, PPP family, 3-phenylpropionic acid transporter [Marininema mesophilum]